MKKVKKILLGLSIPAAALAMSVGSMFTIPMSAKADTYGPGFHKAGTIEQHGKFFVWCVDTGYNCVITP